jgi:serine/threonine protein kinase
LQAKSDEVPDFKNVDFDAFAEIDFGALCNLADPGNQPPAPKPSEVVENKYLSPDLFYTFDKTQFRIKEWKGSGGFGSVFWAKHPKIEGFGADTFDVAVKVFHPSRGAEIVGALIESHRLTKTSMCPTRTCEEGILPILEVGSLKSDKGEALSLNAASFPLASASLKVLRSQTRLDMAANPADMKKRLVALAEIWKSLQSTITKFEDKQLVHGDFKASNILVRDGKLEVADFDSVKKFGQKPLFATPANAAPEQLENMMAKGTDRFATANLMFYMAGFNNLYEISQGKEIEKITFDDMTAFFKDPKFDQKMSVLFNSLLQTKSLEFRGKWKLVEVSGNSKPGELEIPADLNVFFTSMLSSLRRVVYLDRSQRTIAANSWTNLANGTNTVAEMMNTYLGEHPKCKLPALQREP